MTATREQAIINDLQIIHQVEFRRLHPFCVSLRQSGNRFRHLSRDDNNCSKETTHFFADRICNFMNPEGFMKLNCQSADVHKLDHP
jgi:hypothetical protein